MKKRVDIISDCQRERARNEADCEGRSNVIGGRERIAQSEREREKTHFRVKIIVSSVLDTHRLLNFLLPVHRERGGNARQD